MMKKILYLVIALAGVYAFYEQSKPNPNVIISAICIAVFMIGLLLVNQKTTSNTFLDSEQPEENDDK